MICFLACLLAVSTPDTTAIPRHVDRFAQIVERPAPAVVIKDNSLKAFAIGCVIGGTLMGWRAGDAQLAAAFVGCALVGVVAAEAFR